METLRGIQTLYKCKHLSQKSPEKVNVGAVFLTSRNRREIAEGKSKHNLVPCHSPGGHLFRDSGHC